MKVLRNTKHCSDLCVDVLNLLYSPVKNSKRWYQDRKIKCVMSNVLVINRQQVSKLENKSVSQSISQSASQAASQSVSKEGGKEGR